MQSAEPRPQIIIPSAAFGGAMISFILCPSELVKVKGIGQFLDRKVVSRGMLITLTFSSVGCKFKAQTL